MLKKWAIVTISVLAVLLVGTGGTQSLVLCYEADGDTSVDRAGACSCSWGGEEKSGGYGTLILHSGDEHLPSDGCDPCTDVPLKIDAVRVANSVSFLQDNLPKTGTNSAVLWTKALISPVPPIWEIQRTFSIGKKLPIYLRIASILI